MYIGVMKVTSIDPFLQKLLELLISNLPSIIVSLITFCLYYRLLTKQVEISEIQTKIIGFSYEPMIIPIIEKIIVPIDTDHEPPSPLQLQNIGSSIAFNIDILAKIFKSDYLFFRMSIGLFA